VIEIKPISENDFQSIVDWNTGKDENYLYQWAGHKVYKYPLSIDQIKARVQEEKSKIFSILYNGKVIGSIELDQIDAEKSSAKVCRFILSDEVKSKGIGMMALKQLSDIAFNEIKLDSLILTVYCFNAGAIRCYEKSGFWLKNTISMKMRYGIPIQWNC